MLRLRPAEPEDYEAFVRLFPGLGVDDPIPLPARWSAELVPGTTVAERGGEVLGYCYCQIPSDSVYVRNVVVAPSARRAGIGRALMERARAEGRRRGLRLWQLNVKQDNVPAIRLYQSLGLSPRYTSLSLRFPWSLLARLPEAAVAASARSLDPVRAAMVERRFDLPAGMVTLARSSDRHVLLELADSESGAPLGYARFSPQFPGAFPFRLADPTLSRRLLAEMQRHALPELDHVQVVVEDDAALGDLLVDAGGEIRHEIVHYTGPL